jgi:hypothetical protein
MQTTDKPLSKVVAGDLAAFIRSIDGNNTRPTGTLAAALTARIVHAHNLVINSLEVQTWIQDLNSRKNYGAAPLADMVVQHVEETYGFTQPSAWFPNRPPYLDHEDMAAYTNRILGINMDRKPFDHHRRRQCAIGWHLECSDKRHSVVIDGASDGCECPCHRQLAYAAQIVRAWNGRNPIGTVVRIPHDRSEPPVETTSEAYVDEAGWPVVELDGWSNAPWLAWLEPVDPKADA